MRPFASAVLAALACAGTAQAQEGPRPAPPPAQVAPQPVPPKLPDTVAPPPLSPEDAELVKELALLEQLELVKNLELFQPDPDTAPKAPQRQP